jgi:hypothetical protein
VKEIRYGLKNNYLKIIKIFEIWRFNSTVKHKEGNGIFTNFIQNLMKAKYVASGVDGMTEAQKDDFIETVYKSEGYRLNKTQIEHNPGKRLIAKIILNSPWGKLAERTDRSTTEIISTASAFYGTVFNPVNKVKSIIPIDRENVVISYQKHGEFVQTSRTVCLPIACYVTAHARLTLHKTICRIGREMAYTGEFYL